MPGFMPGSHVFMLRIEDVDGTRNSARASCAILTEKMISITDTISIDESELTEAFVRASGPGGQNVNKVSSAVQLRFDARRSPSLPNDVALRLMGLAGKRLTKDGVIVIIAQQHRTQERNRADARERLFDLIRQAAVRPVPRRPTKVPKAQRRVRLEGKKHRSTIKKHRSGKAWD
jgi:ribosome-associated protein